MLHDAEWIGLGGACYALWWWGSNYWRSYRVRKYGIKLKNGRKPWE